MQNLLNSGDCLLYIKSSQYRGLNECGTNFLKEITGLQSSAGAVVLSREKSSVFVDGRYELAAKLCIDQTKFEINQFSKKQIVTWIKNNFKVGSNIYFDARFFSHEFMKFFQTELCEYKFINKNFDRLFNTKIEKRESQIISIPDNRADTKFDAIYQLIDDRGLDAYLICDPCSIAWLLNIRDLKTEHTPVLLCYLLVTKHRETILYVDDSYDSTIYKSISDIESDLKKYNLIGADFAEIPYNILHDGLIDLQNPVDEIKCVKSDEELQNIRIAAKQDSATIIEFIRWFSENSSQISEMDCVRKILQLRKMNESFVGNSFDTIAAADENAAIIHYSPSENQDKIVENILLLDSGGQYKYGTTDITRTLSRRTPTETEKLYYTLVLKGHIAVATAKIPCGESAASLDSLSRKYLQQHNLDFNHSTGHGIGYMLGVHEGPIAISKYSTVELKQNMLLSNEPGLYLESKIGIRLENMMVSKISGNYIEFDTISLVPFDRKFINFALLDEHEISWLQKYNDHILDNEFLSDDAKKWLIAENYIDRCG